MSRTLLLLLLLFLPPQSNRKMKEKEIIGSVTYHILYVTCWGSIYKYKNDDSLQLLPTIKQKQIPFQNTSDRLKCIIFETLLARLHQNFLRKPNQPCWNSFTSQQKSLRSDEHLFPNALWVTPFRIGCWEISCSDKTQWKVSMLVCVVASYSLRYPPWRTNHTDAMKHFTNVWGTGDQKLMGLPKDAAMLASLNASETVCKRQERQDSQSRDIRYRHENTKWSKRKKYSLPNSQTKQNLETVISFS